MTEPNMEANEEAMELCNAILGGESPADGSDEALAIYADGERTK